jgi:hypothetical protein
LERLLSLQHGRPSWKPICSPIVGTLANSSEAIYHRVGGTCTRCRVIPDLTIKNISHYLPRVLSIRHSRIGVAAVSVLLAVVFTARLTLAATAFGCETAGFPAGTNMAMEMPMPGADVPADSSEPRDTPALPTDCEALAPCAVAVAPPSDESFIIVTPVRRDLSSENFDVPLSRHVRPAFPPPRA